MKLENMTNEELADKMVSCQNEIESWLPDLQSHDEDEAFDAGRFLKVVERQLEKIQQEMKRRMEVKK